jgi:hypothetical protein
MAGLGGIIAGALGGAGGAYAEAAQGELKNQQRMDLEKQMAEVAFERDQRIKEADTQRSRAEVEYRQRPEVIENASIADLLKSRLALGNRAALAPETATAVGAENEAMAPVAAAQAERDIESKINAAKTLGGSKEFLEGTAAVSRATKAAEIDSARIRAESGGGGGGGGKAARVQRTVVNENGTVTAIMSDGSTKDLGIKSADFNKQIANTIATMTKNDIKFGKLPEAEKRAQAVERLTGNKTASSTSGPTTDRPPLGTFNK